MFRKHRVRTTAAVAALATMAALTGTTMANGIGDIYAASASGVLELHGATASVVNTVAMAKRPQVVAFSNDGHKLYATTSAASITRVDIQSISLNGSIAIPEAASALAHPQGTHLVAGLPTAKTLALIDTTSEAVTQTSALPGTPNLLAADRRDSRVITAEKDASWFAVVDASGGTPRTQTISGSITGLAVDRATGSAYVTTHAPDALLRVSLSSLETEWTATLSGTPAGVTATSEGAVVVIGNALWRAGSASSKQIASTAGAATSITTSDDGGVILVAEDDRVEAFYHDALAKTIALTGKKVTSVIGVPANSSLLNASIAATPVPGSSEKPVPTDTISDIMEGKQPPIAGALLFGFGILGAFFGGYQLKQRFAPDLFSSMDD